VPTRDITEADRQHHDRERRLAQHRPDHEAFEREAEGAERGDRHRHREPERKAERRHQRQPAERAQHHQLALREADRLGGLVDENEAERDETVDATLCDAADDELHELQEASALAQTIRAHASRAIARHHLWETLIGP